MPSQYVISRFIEQTDCENCGQPLEIGDEAIMSDDEKHVACSMFCLRQVERANAPLRKPQPEGVKAGCFDV